VIQERDIFQQNSLVNKKYLETIKIKDGEIFHLSYHQKRLSTTLGKASFFLKEIITPPKEGLYRCRVVYDANAYTVEYFPYSKRSVKSLKLVYCDAIKYDKKYANRSEIDTLMEQKGECDDILIVKDGLIRDTSIANVAFKQNKQWFTPLSPLLHGTTRQRLFDTGKIKVKDIRVEDLKNFSQIALMNAMIDFDIITNENIREIIC